MFESCQYNTETEKNLLLIQSNNRFEDEIKDKVSIWL